MIIWPDHKNPASSTILHQRDGVQLQRGEVSYSIRLEVTVGITCKLLKHKPQ